jgi:hypothetical protein
MASAEGAIAALEKGGLSDAERKDTKMRLGDLMRRISSEDMLTNDDPTVRSLLDNWDKWLKIGK